MGVRVREIDDADLPVVAPWFDDAETQVRLGPRSWLDRARRQAATESDRHALVVIDEAGPAAVLDVEVQTDGRAGFAIAVDPRRRGTGLGRAALDAALGDDRFGHVLTWRVGVEHDHVASRTMFERYGFRLAGERDPGGFDYLALPVVAVRARQLLGRKFRAHGVTVEITEVEAYSGTDDPASHAYTRTPRSEIMYGPPWRLYVYRSYGIHHCANIVTGPTAQAAAVLLRAGRVVDGLELARSRRTPGVADEHLARGPGNLAQALGITADDKGVDVRHHAQIRLGSPPHRTPEIQAGPRVGIAEAADWPWRFWIPGDPTVSAYRPHPRHRRRRA